MVADCGVRASWVSFLRGTAAESEKTMSGKNMSSDLSVRPRISGKRFCQALAVAAPILAASTSAQAGRIGIHVEGSTWGIWITINTSAQNWSNVNADGSAGDLAFSLPGVDPAMGLLFPVPGQPDITGADSNMAMGDLSISGLGSSQLALPSLHAWITGSSGWGVHGWLGFALALAFEGTNPDGTLNYGLHGVSIPLDFDVTPVGGGPSMPVQQIATDISWTSDARIPTPGAFALIGVGALTTLRRRRS